jgi:hypothetical protein
VGQPFAGLAGTTFTGGFQTEGPVDGLTYVDYFFDGPPTGFEPPYEDGDIYSVTLTDSTGIVLLSGSGVARYQQVDVGCGDVCTSSQVKL